MGFREEDHKGEVPFPSCRIQGTGILSAWLLAVDVDLDRLYCKSPLFPPFHHSTLWKDTTVCSPRLRCGNYVPYPLVQGSAGISWNSPTVETCLFFPKNLLISVWTHGYLFYALGSNLVLLSLLLKKSCSSFSHWELFLDGFLDTLVAMEFCLFVCFVFLYSLTL